MLVALDQGYFFSLLHLGCKEALWNRTDFHPLLESRIRPSPARERSLLLYSLLFDDLLFSIPFEFSFYPSDSLFQDIMFPDGLIETKTGWSVDVSNKSSSASSCLGYLHNAIYGVNPHPLAEESDISLDPLTLLPEAAVSIVSALGGGPRDIPITFIRELLNTLLDQDKKGFESVALKHATSLKRIRETQMRMESGMAKALAKEWKHTILRPQFREMLYSRATPLYDDPYLLIDPADLMCTGPSRELLSFASLLLSCAYRFKDLLCLDDLRGIDSTYRVGLSMQRPSKKIVPKFAYMAVYSVAIDRFANEGLFLPVPRTLSEAQEIRTHQAVSDFRQVVWGWCDAAATGDSLLLKKLTNDIDNAAKVLQRKRGVEKVGKYLAFAGLPLSVVEMLLGLPVIGPVVTAVGFVTQMLSELDQKRNRWVQLIE